MKDWISWSLQPRQVSHHCIKFGVNTSYQVRYHTIISEHGSTIHITTTHWYHDMCTSLFLIMLTPTTAMLHDRPHQTGSVWENGWRMPDCGEVGLPHIRQGQYSWLSILKLLVYLGREHYQEETKIKSLQRWKEFNFQCIIQNKIISRL